MQVGTAQSPRAGLTPRRPGVTALLITLEELWQPAPGQQHARTISYISSRSPNVTLRPSEQVPCPCRESRRGKSGRDSRCRWAAGQQRWHARQCGAWRQQPVPLHACSFVHASAQLPEQLTSGQYGQYYCSLQCEISVPACVFCLPKSCACILTTCPLPCQHQCWSLHLDHMPFVMPALMITAFREDAAGCRSHHKLQQNGRDQGWRHPQVLHCHGCRASPCSVTAQSRREVRPRLERSSLLQGAGHQSLRPRRRHKARRTSNTPRPQRRCAHVRLLPLDCDTGVHSRSNTHRDDGH